MIPPTPSTKVMLFAPYLLMCMACYLIYTIFLWHLCLSQKLYLILVSFTPAIQDDAESIHQLLLLLSDPSIEVKQNALTDLMKLARESSPSLWENQFKDILMSVVEKMKDPEVCSL